ncbi:MAG: tRNA (N6-isopentenyl adenosine(37)-C2)-methylthiotransferase MiaB, partial [Candidatus Shapirobacteria bacterium]
MKKQTYHIITIGCQMNQSDSERIAGYLEGFGFRQTSKRERASLVVLTTCGVRQSAEDRVYMLLPKIKKENPKAITVVTGCLSGRADVQ